MNNVASLEPNSQLSPRCFLESDFGEISKWWTKRQKNAPIKEILPMHGRIIPGVAVGFLYRTDSALGLLDFFATNPEARIKERKEGMEKIVSALLQDAKKAGMKILYTTTQNKSVVKIGKKFGAHVESEPFFAMAKVI